jgi:branched-chain amino acid transport system permease protein
VEAGSALATQGTSLSAQLREIASKYGLIAMLLLLPVICGVGDLLGAGKFLFINLSDEPTLSRLGNNLVDGLSNGAIWALIALGYTLVYGIIELINFAHGDLFMIGSFVSVGFWGSIGVGLSTGTVGVIGGLVATLIVAMLACGSLNVLIERVGYRPLRQAPKLAPLITAVGFSFILQNVGLAWQGAGRLPVPELLPSGNLFNYKGVRYEVADFMVIAITIPLLVVLTWLIRSTKAGKAMRATAQDRDASAMMGINVDRTISFTFAIAGALAGAGGTIYVLNIGITNFQLGFRLGLFAFTAAVLGGIGNLTGAVAGGLLLGLISAYNDGFGDARWTYTIVFSILILILVFRPSGLFGEQTPEGQ